MEDIATLITNNERRSTMELCVSPVCMDVELDIAWKRWIPFLRFLIQTIYGRRSWLQYIQLRPQACLFNRFLDVLVQVKHFLKRKKKSVTHLWGCFSFMTPFSCYFQSGFDTFSAGVVSCYFSWPHFHRKHHLITQHVSETLCKDRELIVVEGSWT